MSSLQGRLLVASPELLDPNFHQSVVLMVQHGESGALGLILNRPLENTIQEVWTQVNDKPCDLQCPVYLGGPVDGPIMALHGDPELSDLEVFPGVYFCVELKKLARLVRKKDESVKFFIGHSGWGDGQLEGEIAEGAWRLVDPTKSDIFQGEADLWDRTFSRASGASFLSLFNIKQVPPDPTWN